MSHYQDYKARFDRDRALLQVPNDCTARTPDYRPSQDLVDPHSWDFSWFLTFVDKHYVCCHEVCSYRKRKLPTRQYFSFHYGPIVRIDKNGTIDRDPNNPVVIRIDKKTLGHAHLHYRRPHPFPHYEQKQIDGLVLETVDMFQFVNAIFRSRSERTEVHLTMGFADPEQLKNS